MPARNKIAYLICAIFFIAYSILSITRHNHFGSYGFDLGIADQVVWNYSQFQSPITTIDHITFIPELFVHLEFIYILLSPFYWIYSNPITLLLLQALAISFSGIPIFLLAKRYKLNKYLSYSLLTSYLMFYGIQNAVWFDVHSTVFGVSFLAWFIYFLDLKNLRLALVAFFLTIICKENYAAMTLLISLVYLFVRRDKKQFIFIGLSLLYLLIVFGIYYPSVGGYRFQSKEGLLGGVSLFDLYNTHEKRQVFIYTFGWTGFLSFFHPIFIIPAVVNLASYFILGREVSTAQGLFLQYRIELAPLLFWATIYGIIRFKKLNSKWVGVYLMVFALLFQYLLHLPLSYLSKSWFWTEPASVKNINKTIAKIPKDSSVVSQNNITPHLSNRKLIFTLYPTEKDFEKNSPCGQKSCHWFRWDGNPEYLIVETSTDWDERSFLVDRQKYLESLQNLEKFGVIRKEAQEESAILYKVLKNPNL